MFYRVFSLLLICFYACAQSDTNGILFRVVDGDTFVFISDESDTIRIRMEGIDTPEKKQYFGFESTTHLKQYEGMRCSVAISGYDRYRRGLGTLFIDGNDINLEMLKEGFAWHYKKYNDNETYSEAEITAKNNKAGLWGFPNIPPWEYRKLRR